MAELSDFDKKELAGQDAEGARVDNIETESVETPQNIESITVVEVPIETTNQAEVVQATRLGVEEVFQKSPELDSLQIETTHGKLGLVKNEYYVKREKALFGEGFTDYTQGTCLHYDPNYKKGLDYFFSSMSTISSFKKWGISDPKGLCKVLWERGNHKPAVGSGTREHIMSYADMSPEDIGTGMDRLEKLGFTVVLRSEYKDIIKRAADIPEENFNNIIAELNPYSFLKYGLNARNHYDDAVQEHESRDKSDPNIVTTSIMVNPLLDKFLESAERGHIDPIVAERLDTLAEVIVLSEPGSSRVMDGGKGDFLGEMDGGRQGEPNSKSLDYIGEIYYGRDYQTDFANIFDVNKEIVFRIPPKIDHQVFDDNFKSIWHNLDTFGNGHRALEELSAQQIDQLPENNNGMVDFLLQMQLFLGQYNSGKMDDICKLSHGFDIKSSFKKPDEKSDFFAEFVNASKGSKDLRTLFETSLKGLGNIAGIFGIELTDAVIEAYYINVGNLPDEQRDMLEKLFENFSEKGKKMYQIFEVFRQPYDRAVIIDNQDNLDALFDSNFNPSSMFTDLLLETGRNYSYANFPLDNLSDEDKAFWSIIRQSGRLNESIYNAIIRDRHNIQDGFNPDLSIKLPYLQSILAGQTQVFATHQLITEEFVANRPEAERQFWDYTTRLSNGERFFFIQHVDEYQKYFDESGGCKTSNFYHDYLLTPYPAWDEWVSDDIIAKFPSKSDRDFWKVYNIMSDKNTKKTLLEQRNLPPEYYVDGKFTKNFFEFLKNQPGTEFNMFFAQIGSREDWTLAFGADVVKGLLKALPDGEAGYERNAFTHHPEYDRVSPFFGSLMDKQAESGFELNPDGIAVTTEYIKHFGLSDTPIVYRYFKAIYEYSQGKIEQLPQECIDSNITGLEQLKNQIDAVEKQCMSREPFDNLELSPLQLDLLSVATGHSNNRFTRIPIDRIVRDFSIDLRGGNIAPLAPQFQPALVEVSRRETKNTVDLESSQAFTSLKNELLASVDNLGSVDDLVVTVKDIFTRRIADLKSSDAGMNDFMVNQVETFNAMIEKVSQVKTIDEMLKTLVPMAINLGGGVEVGEQANYNSVLRQLVFRRVLERHGASNFTERLRNSLSHNPGPAAIIESLNFMDNLVKDHALNLETNNDEKYWDPDTFVQIKKYAKVFKKNLNIGMFTKELESILSKFEVEELDENLDIDVIPDRGLTGELAGYMADVCYTKVYPLLSKNQNVVPYKFVASPKSDNPEIIGSTLVFQVNTAEGEPVLLIRAFDIPTESTIDIGSFFEQFTDLLVETAKKLGVKKILVAGTSGTVSNYTMTTNYVMSNYVTNKSSAPLSETFDFNINDITNECYVVREV